MLMRVWVGISVDGFAADSNGAPAWDALGDLFDSAVLGYGQLLREISAVVMGRVTYEQCLKNFGLKDWPWPKHDVYVLTSRPLGEGAPSRTLAWTDGPAALLAHLKAARLPGDVKIMGGPHAIQAMREVGGIDRYEIFTVPVLLGEGIPLFPASAGRISLKLENQQECPHGVVKTIYSPA